MERPTRRDFLKLAGAGFLALEGAKYAVIGNYLRENADFPDWLRGIADKDYNSIGAGEAAQLALRMDKISDSFAYRARVGKDQLTAWAAEVIPFYEYEGAVESSRVPEKLDFQFYVDGDKHNHILGQSDCHKIAVLNLRVANPVSAWYETKAFLPTIIHELAHVQQQDLCQTQRGPGIENSAQIVTWEILAAMANAGNKEAAYALIHEMRDTATSVVQLRALEMDKKEVYDQFRKLLSNDAVDEARYEKSMRRWAKDPGTLRYILTTYDETPLIMVTKAMAKDDWVEGLTMPIPAYRETATGEMERTNGLFKVDDLHYFLAHAEAIIKDYNTNPKYA